MAITNVARPADETPTHQAALLADRDDVHKKLTQARALNALMWGETQPDAGFRGLSEARQDEILWLLGDLIADSLHAFERIERARNSGVDPEFVDIPVVGVANTQD